MQHLAIEEVEGVAAGGEGSDRTLFGLSDGLQELADLGQAQLPRMTLAVEQDEAARPIRTALAEVWLPELCQGGLAHAIEQARCFRRGCRLDGHAVLRTAAGRWWGV